VDLTFSFWFSFLLFTRFALVLVYVLTIYCLFRDSILFRYAATKAREKAEKAEKLAQQKAAAAHAAKSPKTPSKKLTAPGAGITSGTSTPTKRKGPLITQRELDMAGLNLGDETPPRSAEEPPPKLAMAREKLLEEVKASLEAQSKDKLPLSLVVIGTYVIF
jgi:hypothetical protein